MMDPRGIVAASSAATFTAPLVALEIGGAGKLLPATFLVIVLTVLVYGLSAVPAVRALGLTESDSDSRHSRR
jgi:NhaP-type Na+/H+ or K+/H+ antiporter